VEKTYKPKKDTQMKKSSAKNERKGDECTKQSKKTDACDYPQTGYIYLLNHKQQNTMHLRAKEGQSASGGEGGSKISGRHVDGSGAEAGKESTTRRQVGVEE